MCSGRGHSVLGAAGVWRWWWRGGSSLPGLAYCRFFYTSASLSPKARFGLGNWMWKMGLELRCLLLIWGKDPLEAQGGDSWGSSTHGAGIRCLLPLGNGEAGDLNGAGSHPLCRSCSPAKWKTRSRLLSQPATRWDLLPETRRAAFPLSI